MHRREFIKTATGLILLGGATPWPDLLAATDSAGPSGPLNLLFITADDMNGCMPGFMGNPLKPTPNMDAFAASCHRFVNNHDAAPICQPSREAMMTGLSPNRSGALGFNPVNQGTPTLVTILKEKGYFTGALNKLKHMQPASCFPWDFSANDSGRNPVMIENEVAHVVQLAKAAGKPFFLNVNCQDPHRPFYEKHVSAAEAAKMGNPIDVVAKLVIAADAKPPSFLEDLPSIREEFAAYTNSVQRLDMSFGKAIAAVQAAGELERTIVVFVSDHGMPFPLAKATCYWNGSWCPVFLRWPGMGDGKTHDHMTSSLDLAPTLLELLGIPPLATQDGQSWAPWVKSGGQPEHDYAICNVNRVSSGIDFPQRSVTTKTGAFMVNIWSNGTNELRHLDAMKGTSFIAMQQAAQTDPRIAARVKQYVIGYPMAYYDLVKDPDERINVLNEPAYAGEVKRLQGILLDYMKTTNDARLPEYQTLLAGGAVDFKMEPAMGKKGKGEEE